MKLKRIECTLFLLLAVLTAYSAGISLWQNTLSDEVVRLRVVAEADDFRSQSRKLLVRDAILTYCDALLPQDATTAQVQALLADHLNALAQTAQVAVGAETPVLVRLAEGHYPTRTYQAFSLPAGRYVGLQVYLGAAQGRNWWCVLYPSLCGGAVQNTDSRYDQTTFAFKSVEVISNLCEKLWS